MRPVNDKGSSLGEFVRHVRVQKGLRQRDVAERAHISVQYYYKLESGEAMGTPNTWHAIAHVLGLTDDLDQQLLRNLYMLDMGAHAGRRWNREW